MSSFLGHFKQPQRPQVLPAVPIPRPPPPPVPIHSRPSPSQSTSPPYVSADIPSPGAVYSPGKWPTPELPLSPLGKFQVLAYPDFGWTSQSIQSTLDALGDGATLYLPQTSHWEVNETIMMHPYQELATEGYPEEERNMAMLEATETLRPHVVSGWDRSGVKLRNLVVEGNQHKFGRDDDGGALISMGANAKHQWVDRCVVRNPRQWSCLQVHEGCTNVRVTNCRIGPSGVGKDIRDGHWADGISYAGSDGLVAGNDITDATDGAIVVFQAPGSLITSNTIVAYSRLMLGAINMVDYGPHDGDYSHTRVVHNTILTAGSYIIVGIAQGPSAWGGGPSEPSPNIVNRGAVVARNLIHFQDRGRGRGAIGYGFAISADVEDWTCVENASAEGVVYEGDMTDIEWEGSGGLSVAPGPFVRAAGPVEKLGTLQPEFAPGLVRGLLGIKPGQSSVLRLFPGQLRARPGMALPLKEHVLEFFLDGEVTVRHIESGRLVWRAGFAGSISGREATAILDLDLQGHLRILDTQNKDLILHDFTPFLPPAGDSSLDPATGALPTLRLSDLAPHFCLTTPSRSILLSSSYSVHVTPDGPSKGWEVGSYIARPAADVQHTIVSVLSPYAQYVILRTRPGRSMVLPVEWPLDEQNGPWEVMWRTPNPPTSEKGRCELAFQGDGNLVIYTDGGPVWASSTTGDRPARFIRWGDGSREHPFLELLDEGERRLWSTSG